MLVSVADRGRAAPGAGGPADRNSRSLGVSRSVSVPLVLDVLAAAELAIVAAMAVVAKYAYLDGYLRANTSVLGYLGLALVLAGILHFLMSQIEMYKPGALLGPVLGIGRLIACTTVAFLLLLALL